MRGSAIAKAVVLALLAVAVKAAAVEALAAEPPTTAASAPAYAARCTQGLEPREVVEVRPWGSPTRTLPAGEDGVPGHRYSAQELARQKGAVLSTDTARIEALRARDANKLDEIIAVDARFIDGLAAGRAQQLDRQQYLDGIGTAASLSTASNLTDQTARVFGADDDVAVVTGVIRDSQNAAQPGFSYTAIYLREFFDWTWSLVRYQTSPLVADASKPVSSQPAVWPSEDLTTTQRRAFDGVRVYLECLSRRDDGGVDEIVGEQFWNMNGGAGPDQHGKAAFMAFRRGSKVGPELVALDQPDIQLYGVYGEVAVITGVRRDATGGGALSTDFQPQWRGEQYYTAVGVRPNNKTYVWPLQHYHASYIQP